MVTRQPHACSEKGLWTHFAGFGTLSDVEIIRDKNTGNSRGFGFVHFRNAEDAQKAVDSEHTIDGRRCDVKQALPKVCSCADACACIHFWRK